MDNGGCGMLAGIFLTIFGALSLFARDLMWELTQWGNSLRGVKSERSEWWETRTSCGGIVMLLVGIILVLAALGNR